MTLITSGVMVSTLDSGSSDMSYNLEVDFIFLLDYYLLHTDTLFPLVRVNTNPGLKTRKMPCIYYFPQKLKNNNSVHCR